MLLLQSWIACCMCGPDFMYRKWDTFPEAWDEAPEGENGMVTQLFLAVTERVFTGSRKRGTGGTFMNSDEDRKIHKPKYTMDEWHTLTHDIDLLTQPETPVFNRLQGWPSPNRGPATRDTSPQKDGASAGSRSSTGRGCKLAL